MMRLAPLFLAAATVLAVALPATGQAVTAQQQKMKDCNAEAKTKALKGSDRQAFMKTCLTGMAPTAAAVATPTGPATAMPVPASAPIATAKLSPTERMKTCNTQAGTKSLKGDARKQFMASCLKG